MLKRTRRYVKLFNNIVTIVFNIETLTKKLCVSTGLLFTIKFIECQSIYTGKDFGSNEVQRFKKTMPFLAKNILLRFKAKIGQKWSDFQVKLVR